MHERLNRRGLGWGLLLAHSALLSLSCGGPAEVAPSEAETVGSSEQALASPYIAVGAGGYNVAVRADGTAWAWGTASDRENAITRPITRLASLTGVKFA